MKTRQWRLQLAALGLLAGMMGWTGSAQAGELNALGFLKSTPTYVMPSLAINYAVGLNLGDDAAAEGAVFWSGVAFHPVVTADVSPYLATGFELEFVARPDGTMGLLLFPMVRVGISLPSDGESYANVLVPWMSFYGMAGVRPPTQSGSAVARLGVGMSSIWIPLAMLEGGVLLPGVLEGLMEVWVDGHRQYVFRFGWGF